MISCKEHVNVMMRVFGWTLGHQLNTLLDGGAIVLSGEGLKGADVEVWITDEWLEENHCLQHGIDTEIAHAALNHVNQCECKRCLPARDFGKKLLPLSEKDDRTFWLNALLIRMAVEKTGPKKKFIFSRKMMSPSSEIDRMLEAFDMFIGDNRDFWIWPEAKKVNNNAKPKRRT